MNIVLNEHGKIISFGKNVKAESNQVLYELEKTTIPVIKKIAKTNKMEVKSRKKSDIISELHNYLKVNRNMSIDKKFEKIVVDGFATEKSDNVIKRELFNAECDFNDVNKVFNAAVKKHNLRMTPKDRNHKTATFLEGYEPAEDGYNEHLAKISALQDHLGCKSTQAGASMRKWAKDNNVTLPKAPETPKVAGFRGKQKIVTDWYLENSGATFEQLLEFAESNVEKTKTGKDNRREYVITAWNAKIFADQLYAVEPVEEAVEEVEELV